MDYKLPNGAIIKIDLEDIEKLGKYKWVLNKAGYVRNSKMIFLHRLIMGVGLWKENKLVVDHINGDLLDNRKSNLRVCTVAENIRHRVMLNKNNNTGHIGVGKCWGKFRARVMFKRKEYHLGLFDTLEDAILARKQKEKELYGNFTPNLV